MMRLTGHVSFVHNWSDAWVRYLDHDVQFSIFHGAPQQRERNMHILYLRSVDDNKQAPPLSQRPGYREAKEQLRNLQRRKENLAPFIPVTERKRSHNKIDPSLQEHLEWLSTNWEEYFAEEHHQPSSSFSWSPTSWWSSSSWSSNWQRWHQQRWQDDRWSEQW